MTRSIWQILKADELARCRDEINQENRLAIRLLGMVGLPLAVANMIVQIALSTETEMLPFFLRTSWVFLYFLALIAAERWFVPRDYPHATALLYAVEAPVLICSILLGSVWDPDHLAFTFFIFLMAMPMFVLDRPWRVMLITTGWTVLFVIACFVAKPPDIFERDFLHAFEFWLAAIAVMSVVIRVRMVALERLEQAQHNLEHDELTDMRSRRSLGRHMQEYLGKPLTIGVAQLDQLDMYNDVYGRDIGNQVLIRIAEALFEVFGRNDSYRYGGDEALCVVEGTDEQAFLALVDQCREKVRECSFGDIRLVLTCAVGYVTGEPQTEEDFRKMAQLAEIYAHQAGHRGKSQTIGGAFDESRLQSGIIESNLGTYLRSYETNQLTGLPSMSFFVSRGDEILASFADDALEPMAGFLTLPDIKIFNSEFGYAQGDELICHTAQLLREAFPERLICNIAGSQFGIMCYQEEIDPGMQVVSSRLRSYKENLSVACKAGFAKRGDGETTISMLDKARVAERSIHDEPGSLYRIYDERLDADVKLREYIIAHLDEAIEHGYLEVYYQPIIRTSTREICDEEALSRWNDPIRGLLTPCSFIPPLEQSRQIYKLSLYVVKRVLEDFERKKELGMTLVPVSVNISRHDFEQCDMVQAISELVDASGFSHDMIRIEITESAFAENQELLKREVARFRENGFQVWMDDFGSEYSTLNLLQDLDFDLIKIDMQFMRNSEDSVKNLIIVSSIIDMANKMNVSTLVEGVENEDHMGVLRSMGCDKMQGFFFSKPRPLQDVIDRVAAGTARAFEGQEDYGYY